MTKEEFELIPMSPLRRLEKRIEKVESSSPTIDVREFLKELLDILKMNQGLVDELAKANDALRVELSRLPGKLDELISRLDELLSIIKASAIEEVTGSPESFKPMTEKVEQLVETSKKIIETNEAMLSAMEEIGRKLKRPSLPPRPPIVRKPLLA